MAHKKNPDGLKNRSMYAHRENNNDEYPQRNASMMNRAGRREHKQYVEFMQLSGSKLRTAKALSKAIVTAGTDENYVPRATVKPGLIGANVSYRDWRMAQKARREKAIRLEQAARKYKQAATVQKK